MAFKIINNQSDINKSNRLAKELNIFKQQLSDITSKSHNLLQTIRDLADKKSREQLGNKVRET